MFARLNSRIQLTADSFEQYQRLLNKEFDYVIGNPPWGGVLKGPLAPVYDEGKKKRFKAEYPNAARGKYDIYGLFMERGVEWLREGGRFAMVTQDSFLDKEWAQGLRALLANETEMRFIVDLNRFGPLFFRRQNTPAVTVFAKHRAKGGSFMAVDVGVPSYDGPGVEQHRIAVLSAASETMAAMTPSKRRARVASCTAARLPRHILKEMAGAGWDLRPGRIDPTFSKDWIPATSVYEPRQGVTPGGALPVFLMTEERAAVLKLEPELVRRAIKSKETQRWLPDWRNRVLLYPYILSDDGAEPAFTLARAAVKDALDFDAVLDARERELRRGRALDNRLARAILEHRIGLGLVKYPEVARYLVDNFVKLDGRIFKKKRFREFGRRWYEYLWPRDAKLLLSSSRILTPTLVKRAKPTFSLDEDRFLADHACLYLLATQPTSIGREALRDSLRRVAGKEISDTDLLYYVCAFLNSSHAQEVISRRRQTVRGYYPISEQCLSEMPIPMNPDADDYRQIIHVVSLLAHGASSGDAMLLEAGLAKIVHRALNGKR